MHVIVGRGGYKCGCVHKPSIVTDIDFTTGSLVTYTPTSFSASMMAVECFPRGFGMQDVPSQSAGLDAFLH